jgi:hypothetical protein
MEKAARKILENLFRHPPAKKAVRKRLVEQAVKIDLDNQARKVAKRRLKK